MKLIIYKYLRSPNNHSQIYGKQVLRIINTHESFVGIGTKGINRAEFERLANDLEPSNDGFILS